METSNFRKSGRDARAVSIALFPPTWFTGKRDRQLCPTYVLFKQKHFSREEFEKTVLAKLDPKKIYKQYKNSILLCYEPEGQSCHRRWVAEWIENHCGVKVPEVEGPQGKLFPAAGSSK